MRVAVLMSGGVDSSLSAVLLREAGHEIIGLTMKIGVSGSCCKAAYDAAGVARRFKFKHYLLDMEADFERMIIEPFCKSFSEGMTPNPCIICNQELKFRLALRRAKLLGCDAIASGHYSRISAPGDKNRETEYASLFDKIPEARDCHILVKARYLAKDQTYFLFPLKQDQLSSILFPVGGLTKTEVREMAKGFKIEVADKPESQDICFTENGAYSEMVMEHFPESFKPGPILDISGKKIGEHKGIPYYTIGQRHGLNIAVGRPIYVTKISPEENSITVGDDGDLQKNKLRAGNVSWAFFDRLDREVRASAKIRYRNEAQPCTIRPLGGYEVEVEFDEPRRAITPGQAVVFYEGDCVLGGGWITRD